MSVKPKDVHKVLCLLPQDGGCKCSILSLILIEYLLYLNLTYIDILRICFLFHLSLVPFFFLSYLLIRSIIFHVLLYLFYLYFRYTFLFYLLIFYWLVRGLKYSCCIHAILLWILYHLEYNVEYKPLIIHYNLASSSLVTVVFLLISRNVFPF